MSQLGDGHAGYDVIRSVSVTCYWSLQDPFYGQSANHPPVEAFLKNASVEVYRVSISDKQQIASIMWVVCTTRCDMVRVLATTSGRRSMSMSVRGCQSWLSGVILRRGEKSILQCVMLGLPSRNKQVLKLRFLAAACLRRCLGNVSPPCHHTSFALC